MTEEDSQQQSKSRGTGRPRGGSRTLRIGTSRATRTFPPTLPMTQRFISPEAKIAYTERYQFGNMLFEKPLLTSKVDPDFVQRLEKLGLQKLMTVAADVNDTIVREFFANLHPDHLKAGYVMVRRTKVPLTPELINAHYGLDIFQEDIPDYMDGLKKLKEQGKDPLEELRQQIHRTTRWTRRADGSRSEISTTHWPEDWRVQCRFIHSRILPKDNIGHFNIEDLGVLYALNHDLLVNVGKALYREIVSHLEKSSRLAMAPFLIYSLCLDAEVPEYKSDHIAKAPRGIKREEKWAAKLAQTEAGEGSTRGTSSKDAPKTQRVPFEASERRQLSIVKTIQSWFRSMSRDLCILSENQKVLAKHLKVKGVVDTKGDDFDFHPRIEREIELAAL